MSKAATVFLIDLSPQMAKNLPVLKEIIEKQLLERMISARKTDYVGLLQLGSNTTENVFYNDGIDSYQNIYHEIDSSGDKEAYLKPADTQMIKTLRELSVCEEDETVDLLDGIAVAIQMLKLHCANAKGVQLKYDKMIYLFTDGKASVRDDNLSHLLSLCDELSITTVVCLFDKEAANPQTLESLTQLSDRDLGVLVDAGDALEMTKEFKKKTVRQTPVFKGNLTLGDPKLDSHISIPIQMIKKVSSVSLPSAKKMSGIVDRDTPGNGVTVESKFKISQADKDAEPIYVDREQATKAFKFGKIFVPFTEADEEESKFVGTESFSILTFCPSSRVPRECFLSEAFAVIPSPDSQKALVQFPALVAAMQESDSVAIVRYSKKSEPKLGALMYMPKGYAYFIQIPFKDDIRHFTFPPIDFLTLENVNQKSFRQSKTLRDPLETTYFTKKHKLDYRVSNRQKAVEAIDGLINCMDLTESQAFWPKRTFNPAYQRLYQCIISRSLNPDEKGIPEITEKIKSQLEPLPPSPYLVDIQNCFKIEKVAQKVKRRKVGSEITQEAVKNLEEDIAKDLDFLMD